MITEQNCWLYDNCKRLHCNDANGCMIAYKLNFLYDQANVTEALRTKIELRTDSDGSDLEAFKTLKKLQDNIKDFVENGNQLYIHSAQAGNGKTSWSLRLLQTYFNSIWLTTPLKCRGLFINVPSFLLALKDNITVKNDYIKHIKENVLNCDIVIWDDIGTKACTVFEGENLLSMIDTRINNGKANIFTSNLNETELNNAVGTRLASRICNLGWNIEFVGGDKRGLKFENSKGKIK